jgi:hypothetical protein
VNTKEQYEAFQKEMRANNPIASALPASADYLPGGWSELIYFAAIGLIIMTGNTPEAELLTNEDSVSLELLEITRNQPELQLAIHESHIVKATILQALADAEALG